MLWMEPKVIGRLVQCVGISFIVMIWRKFCCEYNIQVKQAILMLRKQNKTKNIREIATIFREGFKPRIIITWPFAWNEHFYLSFNLSNYIWTPEMKGLFKNKKTLVPHNFILQFCSIHWIKAESELQLHPKPFVQNSLW